MQDPIRPRRIRLEASTVCQLRCVSCPTGAGETGDKLGRGFLKFDDFKSVLDRNPCVSGVELSNWGEVFLNPELVKIIQYGYRRNVALFASNGVNLNDVAEDVLEALVRYKFRAMTCSIDGVSQEVYSLYRVRGDFQQVMANLNAINRFKRQYRSPYPVLTWQFVAFGHNEHEIGTARRMARDLGMGFYVKLSWGDLYAEAFSPTRNRDLIGQETGLGVADRAEFRQKFGQEYIRQCCLDLWTAPQLNYDGRVLGCTLNYWGDYGNAFTEGLEGCLNGAKMRYARQMLTGNRESRGDVPCARCKIYKKMRESQDWLVPPEAEASNEKSRTLIMLENKIPGYALLNRLPRVGDGLSVDSGECVVRSRRDTADRSSSFDHSWHLIPG